MTTEEGNKLIRDFMEHGYMSVKLQYDKDWNELMPVVEKIESMWISGAKSTFKIQGNLVQVFHEVGYNNIDFSFNSSDKYKKDNQLGGEYYPDNNTKMQSVYEGVIAFIQWYNTQQQELKLKQ